MRAIEDIVRIYYEAITGSQPISKNDKPLTLGVLVNSLIGKCPKLATAGKNTDRLTGDILPTLSRIVSIYRNAIMHPEMTLDEDHALDVFDNAKAAIASILRDVHEGGHLAAWPKF
jgi:hypothetical protein